MMIMKVVKEMMTVILDYCVVQILKHVNSAANTKEDVEMDLHASMDKLAAKINVCLQEMDAVLVITYVQVWMFAVSTMTHVLM